MVERYVLETAAQKAGVSEAIVEKVLGAVAEAVVEIMGELDIAVVPKLGTFIVSFKPQNAGGHRDEPRKFSNVREWVIDFKPEASFEEAIVKPRKIRQLKALEEYYSEN